MVVEGEWVVVVVVVVVVMMVMVMVVVVVEVMMVMVVEEEDALPSPPITEDLMFLAEGKRCHEAGLKDALWVQVPTGGVLRVQMHPGEAGMLIRVKGTPLALSKSLL